VSELPVFLRIILIPFSMLYGLIIDIRNLLYDQDIFCVQKFNLPVISIGNLTLGGTGKTPFTIFLADALNKNFSKIAIISRGYGRASKGLQKVSDGKQILVDSDKGGDEPVLIASRLPEAIVIVSEDRANGVEFAIKEYHPDLIILDDAYQHRRVHRDVDILLINSGEKFDRNFPIPAGSLREFRHNIKRADIVVLTRAQRGGVQFNFTDKPVFKSSQETNELVDLDFKPVGRLKDLNDKQIAAFAGIAHPENFLNKLKEAIPDIRYFQNLTDHQKYTEEDIINFVNTSKRFGCSHLLCTEKDMVKIKDIKDVKRTLSEANIQLLAVRLNLAVENRQELVKFILKYLDKKE
jgi:tetraacyldisaccharide 4'-kinase